jgi:hypothetical protein
MGRWPREHLHARKRRPPGRTPPQAATPSGTTETLTKLNRDDHARGHRRGARRAADARSETGRNEAQEIGAPAGEAAAGGRRTAWARIACSQWSGPSAAGMRCISRCREAVSPGQAEPGPSPMALSWRRVSQQPLARSRLCMRQRAHPGWAVRGGRGANCSWLSVRPARRCAADVSLVSGGSGWSGRTATAWDSACGPVSVHPNSRCGLLEWRSRSMVPRRASFVVDGPDGWRA